jgi:hypothetical protein
MEHLTFCKNTHLSSLKPLSFIGLTDISAKMECSRSTHLNHVDYVAFAVAVGEPHRFSRWAINQDTEQ